MIAVNENTNADDYYEMPHLWGRTDLILAQQHIISIIASRLRKLHSNARVLDIGCGDGLILHEIKKLFPIMDVVGADTSRNALSHIAADIPTFYGAVENLPFDTSVH